MMELYGTGHLVSRLAPESESVTVSRRLFTDAAALADGMERFAVAIRAHDSPKRRSWRGKHVALNERRRIRRHRQGPN